MLCIYWRRQKCSGVGKIIDECIFDLSKEALKEIDGKISEREKIELIDNLYTTDNLRKVSIIQL